MFKWWNHHVFIVLKQGSKASYRRSATSSMVKFAQGWKVLMDIFGEKKRAEKLVGHS